MVYEINNNNMFDKAVKSELESILQKIDVAASLGEFSITIDSLREVHHAPLNKRGFSVKCSSVICPDKKGYRTTISWGAKRVINCNEPIETHKRCHLGMYIDNPYFTRSNTV